MVSRMVTLEEIITAWENTIEKDIFEGKLSRKERNLIIHTVGFLKKLKEGSNA